MATPWKTVRVFISSTFRDMHAERSYLINEVFLELRNWCAQHRLHLVDVDLRWGVTQEEATHGKVLEICLDEVQRCRPFFIGLLGERYGWTPPEYKVPDEAQYDWVRSFEKGHSLTALEIYHGVLRDPAMKTRACFYFRDPKFIDDIPKDYQADFLAESNDAAKKLLKLKQEIRARCRVYENYPCAYGLDESGNVAVTGLEEFGRRLLLDFQAAISEEHPEAGPAPDALEIERNYHETFIENSTKRFIGRRRLLNQLTEYAEGTNRTLLVVTGKPGSGKSALLAKFAREYAERHAETFVLAHFIGASPGSTDITRTISILCRQIKQRFNLAEDVPTDYNQLRQAFPEFLQLAAANAGFVLVLDGLNQLDESHFSHTIDWLPHTLPQGLRVIVSTLEGDCLDSLRARQPPPPEMVTGSLTEEEQKEIVRQTLDEYRKKLDEKAENNQMGLLLNKAESGNPLFLIVACEEMRVFGTFERVTEKIRTLAENVEGLFGQVLERLQTLHGEVLVKDALSLIECSRHGVLESEMLVLLARDTEQQLPQSIWSRLYWSLKPYLRPPGDGDEGALDFFHDQLSKAVGKQYLSGNGDEVPFHQRLAQHFRFKADPSETGLWSGNYPRGLSELAYHLLEGKLYGGLFQVARDETYLQAQANAFIEEPAIQLDTLQRALIGAAQIDDAAGMAEFMLRHARRMMKVEEISSLDALREGRLEQALNLADLMFSRDRKRGTLCFLLLVWHLKHQGRNEDAKKFLSDLAAKDLSQVANEGWRLDGWRRLAALAFSQLHEVDADSFVVLQEQLLRGEEQLNLCRSLLVIDEKQDVNLENGRIMELAFRIAERIGNAQDRASALREIAKAKAARGKPEEAADTFEEALKTARSITLEQLQPEALSEIAKAQVAAGQIEAALKSAREITDEYWRAEVLAEIVKTQIAVDQVDAALKTAREISNDWRASVLTGIAEAQTAAGQPEQAAKTFGEAVKAARGITYDYRREDALSEIATKQLAAGRAKAAIKTAKEISSDRRRTEVLSRIAQAQVAAGTLAAAIETAREISEAADRASTLTVIAKAQATAGNAGAARQTLEEAVETANGISYDFYRVLALTQIAETQAGAESIKTAEKTFAAALKTAGETNDQYGGRALPLQRIAQAQARVGQFKAALKTAREIYGNTDRVPVLIDVAKAQAVAGKVEEAEKTFGEAIKTARKIEFEDHRGNALIEIVKAQATTGKFDEAFRTIRWISDESWREIALSEIAKAQATAGIVEAAIKTALKVGIGYRRTSALREIAQAQAAAGQVEAALKTAREIKDEQGRAEALTKIAQAQVKVGKLEEALETAMEISEETHRADALSEVAQAQVAAGEVKGAEKAFEAALKTTKKADESWRTSALSGIARAQIATRQFAAALTAAREMSVDRSRASVLTSIARAQATAGNAQEATETFAEALKVALAMTGEDSQLALTEIAQAQAAAGRFETALEIARNMSGEGRRVSLLSDIAQVQAAAGKVEAADKTFAEAMNIAGQMSARYGERAPSLIRIVKALASAGRIEAALETARGIEERVTLERGSRVSALSEIAQAQAAAGQVEAALKTAREIQGLDSETFLADALSEIARAQAAAGQVEAALRTARGISDAHRRAVALTKIAKEQVIAGRVNEADETIAEGVIAAREISDTSGPGADAFIEIATVQAAAGRVGAANETFAAALNAASEINLSGNRPFAFDKIAKAQAAAGLVEEAIRTIRLKSVDAEVALPQVAEVFVSKGAKDSFKELLPLASYYMSASHQMCGLLAQLYSDDEGALDSIAALIMSENGAT